MIKSYTILYIDDDSDDLMLISEAFLKYTQKLTVIHAFNGEEGLSLLTTMIEENRLPCLIIMDINMPVMDGKQALKIIRTSEKIKEIPVVLFSTSTNVLDRQFAKEWNANFISKPNKFTQLESLVQEFVSHCIFEVENDNVKEQQSTITSAVYR